MILKESRKFLSIMSITSSIIIIVVLSVYPKSSGINIESSFAVTLESRLLK